MRKNKLSALLISLLVVTGTSSTAFATETHQQDVMLKNNMPTVENVTTQLDGIVKSISTQVDGVSNVTTADQTENVGTVDATNVGDISTTANVGQAGDVIVDDSQTTEKDQGTQDTTKPAGEIVQAQPTDKDEAVTGTPTVEGPIVETPVIEVPAVEVPVIEVPVATAPAVEAPVVTEAAVEVPVMTTLTIVHRMHVSEASVVDMEEKLENIQVGGSLDLTPYIVVQDEIKYIGEKTKVIVEENMIVLLDYIPTDIVKAVTDEIH